MEPLETSTPIMFIKFSDQDMFEEWVVWLNGSEIILIQWIVGKMGLNG